MKGCRSNISQSLNQATVNYVTTGENPARFLQPIDHIEFNFLLCYYRSECALAATPAIGINFLILDIAFPLIREIELQSLTISLSRTPL